ncbi:helix-turn-helix transcriptional regulator [Clostridium perfringens]|uniref:helix-turn-helix transcriptional regulator n=1 Tax=Clostridium perfringens TaxID=1502 RepID=UPI0039E8D9F1
MPKREKIKTKHNLIKLCHARESIKLVDVNRSDDAEREIDSIHESGNGFIVFAMKDDAWYQWSFKKDDISNIFIQNLLGMDKDTYMSINSFKSPKKLISNLFGLNAIWSDIDFYNTKYKNKTYEEMIQIISKNKIIKKMPPSMFIYSGKGLYTIWLLENAHAGKCLPLWNKLMSVIQEEFLRYGADPKSAEASHVLRLAGSKNSKTGNNAKIVKDSFYFNPRRYNLDEISKLILPELKYSKEEWSKRLAKKKDNKSKEMYKAVCKTISLFNVHSLNYARMQDLQKIVELRKGQCTGMRELIIFLYRYWANCYHKDAHIALDEALELNKMFTEPLTENEVIKATKRAEIAAEIWQGKLDEYLALDKKPSVKKFFEGTGCYIYSNKKLIEILDIQQEEMEKGELLTIINTKEKNRRNKDYRAEWKRNNRRNENGLTPREQGKFDKIYAILEFKEQKITQKEMAEKLGCSIKTIEKYIKEIKEKNITKKTITSNSEQGIHLTKITDTELNLLVI